MDDTRKSTRTAKRPAKTPTQREAPCKGAVVSRKPPKIGSAAADWSRWPAGTMFRLLSTGQSYRVEDYGWALSGRNTIDLYMPNQREMNSWGARQETIEILKWGDPQESLRFLQRHQDYRHIKRMVLEIEGAKRSCRDCGNIRCADSIYRQARRTSERDEAWRTSTDEIRFARLTKFGDSDDASS